MLAEKISLPSFGDKRGTLVPLEEGSVTVPFELRRIYYIYDVDGDMSRGFHAHKKLKQLMICVSGSCDIHLSDGDRNETVLLDSPSVGLLIEKPLWREMSGFSEGCVLMVLASEQYDPDDYIWDFEEFRRYAGLADV